MEISFPGLGLEFEMSNTAFEVAGFPIYWYGIIIAFAFLAAVLLGIRSCKKFGLEPDNILDIVLFAAPAAIIGARLYYVIFSWDLYKNDLVRILNIRDGGLAIYGGVIAAIAVAWIYSKKKKIPPLRLIDFGVPYLLLGQAIGRWGNFVNQEAFGSMTDLPWRMNGTIPNQYLLNTSAAVDLTKWGVHPTFLYESLWDLAVFIILILFRRKKKQDGEVLSLYFILYGVGRFMIEGLRTDSLFLGSFRISQLLSSVLVIVFAAVFIYMRVRKSKASEEEPVTLGRSQYGELLMKLKAEEESAEEGTSEQESDEQEQVDSIEEYEEKDAGEDTTGEEATEEDTTGEEATEEDTIVEDTTGQTSKSDDDILD
jgi:phosphatidylglycerol:prolipoprotein diacylglycerol transferase